MPGTATTILIDGTPTDGSDPWIDSLVTGGAWKDSNGGTVTIQWTAFQGTMDGQNSYGWTSHALNGLREALSLWESVANIDFVEVSSAADADVQFWWGTQTQAGGAGVLGWSDLPGFPGYYENPASETRDVLFNAQDSSMAGILSQGGLGLVTMVHEIGHLLGLAHPHDGGAGADATTFPGVYWWDPYAYGTGGLNQGIYTTMSYNFGWPSMLPGHTAEWYGLQSGPMALDIAAIQAIYGANTTYASGNNVYKLPLVNELGTYWSAIWDTGGSDTISAFGAAGKAIIDLQVTTGNGGGHVSYVNTNSGTLVAGGFTIAAGVVIENAIGGNNDDTLIGNAARNRLDGGLGNDVLDGGAGVDTMTGGPGSDRFYVDDARDTVLEDSPYNSWEIDTVYSKATSYTLAANVENLTLVGTASINGTGNSDGNIIVGNDGDNVLDGGGGIDYLYGGKGDDTYILRFQSYAFELAGEGIDTILTDWAPEFLPDNIENLELLSGVYGGTSARGNALDNRLVGNDDWNTLEGGAGNDTLIGGAGWDTMIGGTGNDSYYVDSTGDKVQEFGDPGDIDTVFSSISYVLGPNLENLVLIGTGDINGTGNGGANILTGNGGANRLDGAAGADTMVGGMGDDTYVVDVAGDVVTEAANQGTDTVEAWLGWTLGANFEQLRLMGTADLNGTGNGLNNALFGTAGKNVLDGGAGTDTMAGGLGDDTYVVDNAGDVVTEIAGGGIDTVRASVSQVLAANVENLILTGTASVDGTGNGLNNTLTGNAEKNVLNGGAGADTMAGGAADDTYTVDNIGDVVIELANGGIDTVVSSINWTLGAALEKLTLTGTANFKGTGNELNNILTGNVGNNLLDGGIGADTMVGGAGIDTYVVDAAGDVVIEAENEGNDLVRASINYTLGNNVERLTLTGAAHLRGTGNALANVLQGNNGNNVLDGKAGADSMAGGLGDDTYIVDEIGDVAIEDAGAGTDTVQSSVTWRLRATFEKLILTGVADINATGNELTNVLTGNSGKNLLDGLVGADTMSGGQGDDIYIVDDAGDRVNEKASEGIDTMRSSVAYMLAANVENLILTGNAAINGKGNAENNVIIGNAADNFLDGRIGADTMEGGAGNDAYMVDNAGDLVLELAGGGADEVQSTISYSLTANVEKLTLLGTDSLNGTGNGLANNLIGNVGNNRLDGGAGADSMTGGLGDDTYVIDNSRDRANENPDAGTDTVLSSISHSLRSHVENLVLTGTAAINGIGNGEGNVLAGNAAANVLDGQVGADTMVGGDGDDTYVVENAGDVVVELAGGGTDMIQAWISYALVANVERLKLYGTADIDAAGNELANIVVGNTGHNILDGGLGVDTVNGGGGGDTFRFSTVLGANNVDRIQTFDHAADTIQLDHSIFAGLSHGVLAAGAFNFGAVATQADDRILYNAANRSLSYDADGLGGVGAVKFATLDALTGTLDHTDFLIV